MQFGSVGDGEGEEWGGVCRGVAVVRGRVRVVRRGRRESRVQVGRWKGISF